MKSKVITTIKERICYSLCTDVALRFLSSVFQVRNDYLSSFFGKYIREDPPSSICLEGVKLLPNPHFLHQTGKEKIDFLGPIISHFFSKGDVLMIANTELFRILASRNKSTGNILIIDKDI